MANLARVVVEGRDFPPSSCEFDSLLYWCTKCTVIPNMVTMVRGPNWKIAVYGRDHGIPHFHIEGPNFRCSAGIGSLDVIIGAAPASVVAAARDWAASNQAMPMATWQELNG